MATVSKGKLKLQRLYKINVPLVGLIFICYTTNIFAHSFVTKLISHFCYGKKLKVIL